MSNSNTYNSTNSSPANGSGSSSSSGSNGGGSSSSGGITIIPPSPNSGNGSTGNSAGSSSSSSSGGSSGGGSSSSATQQLIEQIQNPFNQLRLIDNSLVALFIGAIAILMLFIIWKKLKRGANDAGPPRYIKHKGHYYYRSLSTKHRKY